ncbi:MULTISPECIES: RNA 2',3'-cyclic phosphodiesterase [unclassified Marinobacterium]|uniref:RNA 2',3'-cyclic phosphodiesterase n=1 Tax=unclassified Marinobacterium TaxID=2644139 RepID=UPI00156A3A04|nr:2',5' RNA ligase family [Marinobacterium sp. xm-d-543]NRQ22629.1 2',5' RNA ligase family [Marinobacterium sp. xm-m-312]
MKLRTFFALRITDRTARELANLSDELCQFDLGLDATWFDSSGYHLTLCFLGDVSLEQIEQLEKRATQIDFGSRFTVQLDQVSYYAVNPRLSLIAAMTAQNSQLTMLHEQLVALAEEVGIVCKDQNFMPHVTLARLPADNRFAVDRELPPIDHSLPADSIVLLQSTEGDHGSVYKPLFEVPLTR